MGAVPAFDLPLVMAVSQCLAGICVHRQAVSCICTKLPWCFQHKALPFWFTTARVFSVCMLCCCSCWCGSIHVPGSSPAVLPSAATTWWVGYFVCMHAPLTRQQLRAVPVGSAVTSLCCVENPCSTSQALDCEGSHLLAKPAALQTVALVLLLVCVVCVDPHHRPAQQDSVEVQSLRHTVLPGRVCHMPTGPLAG